MNKIYVKGLLSFLSVSILLCACASNQTYQDKAVADTVKIVSVSMSEDLMEKAAFFGYKERLKYVIQDSKGRSFNVYTSGELKDAEFKAGECVTRWRANSPYYPRLTKSGPRCTPQGPQPPATDALINQQTTRTLKTTAAMDSWLDSTEEALLLQWGVPNQAHEVNGVRYATWTKVSCTQTFYVTKGIITGYKWNGSC